MKDFSYLLQNFFTHKEYLAPADQIPGTLFTPLHLAFAAVLFAIVLGSAVYVARHKKLIKPVFIGTWIMLVVFEVVIVVWESLAGPVKVLDLSSNLSLYPCSIFMYVMPFAIWGKGSWKRMACSYVFTLGLLGASVNFFYPAIRLSSYSCISFVGFHTFIYHGTMLFTFFVMLLSKYHTYTNVQHAWELFLPCVPSLLVSIPANLVNFSPIGSDYMFFTGQFPLVRAVLGDSMPVVGVALIIYGLYIGVPALFYLPSYISQKMKAKHPKEAKEKAAV